MVDKAIQAFGIAGIVSAVGLGLYGRSRTNFIYDFTYNKYHFGVYVQLAAASSMFKLIKFKSY